MRKIDFAAGTVTTVAGTGVSCGGSTSGAQRARLRLIDVRHEYRRVLHTYGDFSPDYSRTLTKKATDTP